MYSAFAPYEYFEDEERRRSSSKCCKQSTC